MQKVICILFFIIAAAFTGCQALQKLTDAQKPNLSVQDVRVTDFAFDEIELTFDIKVENPNPFELHLTSYNYNLKLIEIPSFKAAVIKDY